MLTVEVWFCCCCDLRLFQLSALFTERPEAVSTSHSVTSSLRSKDKKRKRPGQAVSSERKKQNNFLFSSSDYFWSGGDDNLISLAAVCIDFLREKPYQS